MDISAQRSYQKEIITKVLWLLHEKGQVVNAGHTIEVKRITHGLYQIEVVRNLEIATNKVVLKRGGWFTAKKCLIDQIKRTSTNFDLVESFYFDYMKSTKRLAKVK